MSTWRPAPTERSSREATPIASSLAGEVRRLGGPDAGAIGQVFGHWEEIVGPAVAAHSRPRGLRDGVLTVEVDDPAWATQLRWLEAQVLARITEVAGAAHATQLVVRVAGQRPGPESVDRPRRSAADRRPDGASRTGRHRRW